MTKYFMVEVRHADDSVFEADILSGPHDSAGEARRWLNDYYRSYFSDSPDVHFDVKVGKITMDEGPYTRTILIAEKFHDEEQKA